MTKLTPHFSLEEFTASSAADIHGIDNTPTPEHLEHIKVTAAGLERIRTLFNRAVVVSSGYRNPEVNKAVGGVPTSAHALGYAADIHVAGLSDFDAATKLSVAGIPFDQLIYEHGRCVHISFDPRMRHQVLSQPGPPGSQTFPGIRP